MKRVSAMVLVGVLVGGTVGQAQAPLSTALLDARSVYVAGTGVERKWVDRMAEEIQKLDRFTLVGDRTEADLVVTLTTGHPGDTITTLDSLRLVVQDAGTHETLWDDSREVYVNPKEEPR